MIITIIVNGAMWKEDHALWQQHALASDKRSLNIITHHHLSPLIITHHHSSALIITHHYLSPLIITYHHLSSLTIIHYPSSSLLITHHHSSSLIITHHHLSSLVIKFLKIYEILKKCTSECNSIGKPDTRKAKITARN